MSDYEYDSDEHMSYSDGSQGFNYTDEEDNSEDDPDVEKENAYYHAKGLIEDSAPTSEISSSFEKVIEMESDQAAEWTFKALKQLVKLYIRETNVEQVMTQYKRLLQCIASDAVTQNQAEKGVNGILDKVSSQGKNNQGSNIKRNQILAKSVYGATLEAFNPRGGSFSNERLWFKTNLKLGQLLYEMHETSNLQSVIGDLLNYQNPSGQDGNNTMVGDSSTSETNLMEIYALQIQLYSRLKDNKKLREIFDRAMRVQGGIPHPRTIALIQELGGKMHMASREFESAEKAFFQAFKSYDEAGDPSRLRCLKILVMASMLHASTINPFDSQEAKPYRDDPEIKVMTNLVQAFQANQICEFEEILRKNQEQIMADEFVKEHVEDLKRTIRTQVLLSVIVPYTRISLESIAKKLNGITVNYVQSLLISLILDGKLDGRIDQVNGVLEKGVSNEIGGNRSKSSPISSWDSNALEVQDCTALNNLLEQLENFTSLVTGTTAR